MGQKKQESRQPVKYSESFRRSVRPSDYVRKARTLSENDKREEDSIELLYEGIGLFPGDFLLRVRLAKSLYHTQQYAEAEGVARDALKMQPTDKRLNELFGRIAIKTGGGHLGVDAAHSTMLDTEVTPHTYMNKCREFINEGKIDVALQLLHEGVENFPNDFIMLTTLGNAYHTADKYDEAHSLLERALALKPDDFEANRLYRSCRLLLNQKTVTADAEHYRM